MRDFTISVSNYDDRLGFLQANPLDDPAPLERAVRFSAFESAQSHADFLEAQNMVAKGIFLTVCDSDGWAILRPIDTAAIAQSVAKVKALVEAL